VRVCCTSNASGAGPTNDKMLGGEIGLVRKEDGKPANLGVDTIARAWNNDYMRSVRLQMLDGKIPMSCSKCFIEERSGYASKRSWETAYWSKILDIKKLIEETSEDGSVPQNLYYLDIRMGTKCNLKCVMCSPHDSSLWENEWKKVYPKLKNEELKYLFNWENEGTCDQGSYMWHKSPAFWKELYKQIPNLKQLYFAGGEALIIQEYEDLLKKVVDMGYAKNIVVRYNSNGLMLTEELIELWNKFKYVRFLFSIDSLDEMNKYIRYPSSWYTIMKQLNRLDNTGPNVEVTIAVAVQMLNIYYMPDMIKWKLEQNFKKINPWPLGGGLINFHLVYLPAFLNVKVLPQWFKEKVTQKFEDFYHWLAENYRNDRGFTHGMKGWGLPRLKGLITFMNSEDWSERMPQFVEYINVLDEVRGTNFKETFPEMKELLDE
jgi:MoaA/NifB/PqqE/SkfB family radical SAM enzyme